MATGPHHVHPSFSGACLVPRARLSSALVQPSLARRRGKRRRSVAARGSRGGGCTGCGRGRASFVCVPARWKRRGRGCHVEVSRPRIAGWQVRKLGKDKSKTFSKARIRLASAANAHSLGCVQRSSFCFDYFNYFDYFDYCCCCCCCGPSIAQLSTRSHPHHHPRHPSSPAQSQPALCIRRLAQHRCRLPLPQQRHPIHAHGPQTTRRPGAGLASCVSP